MNLIQRLTLLIQAIAVDIKAVRRNKGVLTITTNTTINPALIRIVNVTVPTLGSVTVTFDTSKAAINDEIWLMRTDSLSLGSINVQATSGSVKNPSSNVLISLTSFLLNSSYKQVGWVFTGTDWTVLSAT